MRKFYVTMLFAVLATGVANAQATARKLVWKGGNINITSGGTGTGGFTRSAYWGLSTNLATNATPSNNDTLYIGNNTLSVTGTVNITGLSNIVLYLDGKLSGQTYTLGLTSGATTFNLSSTSAINVGATGAAYVAGSGGGNVRSFTIGGVVKLSNFAATVSNLNVTITGKKSASSQTGVPTSTQTGLGFQLGLLPVVLVDFNVGKVANGISLSWSTQQEYNSKSFSIERSNDGQSWSSIGEVAAAGYSSTPKSYKFTDAAPLATINYYRVRIIDADGKFGLTPVRAIRANGAAKVGVYPNPASGTANILVNAQSGGSFSVSVFNRNGQLVAAKQGLQNTNVVTLDVSAYSAGEYIVDVKFQDGTRQTSKMMVVKQ